MSRAGTTSGVFFTLLKTVFDVLGVKASAASQIGQLEEEWNEIEAQLLKEGPGMEFNNQKFACC
jgi:hypothetical protein